jgi:hypothetical protein
MPRFYLHLYNSIGAVCDEEGVELATLEAAQDQAVQSVRSIVADEAQRGILNLQGRVEIADANGRVLQVLFYREAFELRLSGDAA